MSQFDFHPFSATLTRPICPKPRQQSHRKIGSHFALPMAQRASCRNGQISLWGLLSRLMKYCSGVRSPGREKRGGKLSLLAESLTADSLLLVAINGFATITVCQRHNPSELLKVYLQQFTVLVLKRLASVLNFNRKQKPSGRFGRALKE